VARRDALEIASARGEERRQRDDHRHAPEDRVALLELDGAMRPLALGLGDQLAHVTSQKRKSETASRNVSAPLPIPAMTARGREEICAIVRRNAARMKIAATPIWSLATSKPRFDAATSSSGQRSASVVRNASSSPNFPSFCASIEPEPVFVRGQF